MSRNLITSLAVAAVVVVAGAGLLLGGVIQFGDSGVQVKNTACEDISAKRLEVATELSQRIAAAEEAKKASMETVGDNYFNRHQQLEKTYYECSSKALTSDPCKEAFEKIGRLYEEIMADFDANKGFNEAKFNEREEAKKEYNNCVAQTHKPEFYKERQDKCDADFAAAKETNLQTRNSEEAKVKADYDQSVANAKKSHDEKQAILNEIEKKCNQPGNTKVMRIGPLTTESSGAAIQANSSSCTGVFPGNDANIQRQIAQLEAQLQKAKAGGMSGGLFGTEHIQEALDRLHQELNETPRSCKVDADCGSTVPVCCSATEVGRAVCSAGVCTSEKTQCVSPEICAGKPAMCVAPYMGAGQKDGIYIERTIPEVGTCSQNLQVLKLEQANPESVRYSIVGNIPSWLHIDKPSGSLPGNVNVSYSCNTVQKMGPGNYTVNGSITVYNAANELINTIPLNVSITVTPAPVEMIDAIEYNGKFLPTNQLIIESEKGCDGGQAHWHAAQGVVTATDGTKVSDPGPQCGYGKTSQKPVQKVPATIKK